jgi:hypothetical protein
MKKILPKLTVSKDLSFDNITTKIEKLTTGYEQYYHSNRNYDYQKNIKTNKNQQVTKKGV